MALKQHQAIAWPLIFSALAQTQTELLSGHGAGQAPGTSLPLILAILAHHINFPADGKIIFQTQAFAFVLHTA